MANVTSRGRSGDSNEINAANFRQRLDSAKSEAQIKRVASALFKNDGIQASLETGGGLTIAQKAKLSPFLREAAKKGRTEDGQRIGQDVVERVRKIVPFWKAKTASELKAAVEELTKLADTIHDHCTTVNEHAVRVVAWVRSSDIPGKTKDIEESRSSLQELAKAWRKGGPERERFMKLIKGGDQQNFKTEAQRSSNLINNALLDLEEDVKALLDLVGELRSVDSELLKALQRDCKAKKILLLSAFDQFENSL